MSGIAEQTRNKAYHEHPTKESQCARVRMYLMAVTSGLTIAELSRLMDLPKSTISGRINDLKPAVIESGTRYDEDTQCNVTVWKWIGEQPLLFDIAKQTPAKKLKQINELCLQHPCDLAHKINQIINLKK